MTGRERAYPLPAFEDDSRFGIGLVLDVAKVLEQHGYPPVRDGLDLTELVQALYRFPHVGGAR